MDPKKRTNRRDFFQDVSAGAAGMAFAGVLSTLNAAALASPQKPDYYDKMDMSKLGNVVREPNVVEFKPWKSMHASITSPMITAWGAGDIPQSKLAIGFAYITTPESLGGATHTHEDHDQWIFLIGGNGRNFLEFDAEAEMLLGDTVRKVDYSCYFFIPKGTPHCPLVIKRVGKPIVFIDARVNE
ncbi:MAG: cupin domain-containing protein [Acidobacteria bacterium]|nr:cupin domain-containing protein [Acidobacteriota bacterium]